MANDYMNLTGVFDGKQTVSNPVEQVVSEILKYTWGYGNRCRKLHIIPSMERWCVAPCGFEPEGSPGGTVSAEWVSIKETYVIEAFNNKEPKYNHTLCKKCLDIALSR